MTWSPLAVPLDPTTDPKVIERLRLAAAGDGPLLVPHAADDAPDLPSDPAEIDRSVLPEGGGIAVGTSGSTGVAKRAVLAASALAASADATHARLGGPGRWLLALPAHHIAGLQVVLRSLRAGHVPATVPPGSFTPEGFVAGVRALEERGTGERRYTSLVPTQLTRVLADPDATAAATCLDAVLIGGSGVRAEHLNRAREAGIPVVTTYGMSETCGGCVYDGVPLDGVHLRLDHGRIHLGGPAVACGYLVRRPETGNPFVRHGGLRWFRTDDVGHLDEDGRLVIDGRVDDVIVSGGLKVWPSEVERALASHVPDGCDLAVVGIPDPEWGHRVAIAVECTGRCTADLLTDLLDHARDVLPVHARPRVARVVHEMPRLGPGKPDRTRITDLLMQAEWDDGTSPSDRKEG